MAKEQIDAETGEVIESKSVVVTAPASRAVMVNGVAVNIIKRVNVPTLKQESGETVCFRIDLPLRTETNVETKTVKVNGIDTVVQEEKSITIARVTEMSSGQPFEYVCNAMTADNLIHTYPNDGYVGKWFGITKHGVVAGKRYKDVTIVEIEPASRPA